MIKKILTLLLLISSNVFAVNIEIFYEKPFSTETFHVKKGNTVTIYTNKPVIFNVKNFIIDGTLKIKEKLLYTKKYSIKGHSIERFINKAASGESVNQFTGGKPFHGNGGGGATSFFNGVNADLKGDSLSSLIGINKVVTGGKGGTVGLSGGVVVVNSKNIKINGSLDIAGEPGEKGTPRKEGQIFLKEACLPYECCKETGSKGMCLEVGVCQQSCDKPLSYTIGKGGDGSHGADGVLLIPKESNYQLKSINFLTF